MTTPEAPAAILLVDDVPANLVALVALLRQDDVALHTAASAREALELLLRNEYALALLDVQMPEIDGFELAEIMRSNPRTRHVPIIFLTANLHEPHRLFQGYEAGAVDFLIKPIEPRVLSRKVSTFLELFEQKRQLRRQLGDLERVTGELKEALRLSETFVAALGHDLRNPLTAVSFGLGTLERKMEDPAQRRTIVRMRSATLRMTGIIDQLYDVARVRLGEGLELQLDLVDAFELVGEVVHEHQIANPALRMNLETRGDGHGIWDRVRLSRVASNLIGNAAQHGTADGEISVVVDGSDGDTVHLSVANAGAIPESVRGQLFQPFRRGTDNAVKGLGLGLFIVHEIAAAHGGTVTCESSVEMGTRFVVALPRRR